MAEGHRVLRLLAGLMRLVAAAGSLSRADSPSPFDRLLAQQQGKASDA